MKTVVSLFFILSISAISADISKKYYIFKQTKLCWHGAFIDCLSRDMQLATINSAAEQSALEAAMKDENIVAEWLWVSGTDVHEEGTFVWMSTGKAPSFTKWMKGQPDNYEELEHCMHIFNPADDFGAWNDIKCSSKLYYICEDKPRLKVKLEMSMDVNAGIS